MTTSTVLILGANGRFGLAAAQAFADAGWNVLAQTRRPFADAMPKSARHIGASLTDTDTLTREARGATVVVYAVNPAYTRWGEEALPFARAGMDVAQRLDATFMLPGNVYNFGEGMPPLLREDTPQQPSTDKGRIRCAMEAEMAARSAQGMRSIVVRAGDFYGAGKGSWMDLVIVKSLRSGKLVYPGPLDVPHAWAYLPDLARCFVALAEKEGLPAVTHLHFPGHTLTGHELLGALANAASELSLRPAGNYRQGRMPWGLIRVLAWAVPMSREVVKMSYLWRVAHALDGALLAKTIGPVPTTPLAEALRSTLLALGHGKLGPAAAAATDSTQPTRRTA